MTAGKVLGKETKIGCSLEITRGIFSSTLNKTANFSCFIVVVV